MPVEQARHVVDELGLTYPVYADPTWKMFETYGVGYSLGAPKASWVIIDAAGVVQWTWRRLGASGRVPMPAEVLTVADGLFGTGSA